MHCTSCHGVIRSGQSFCESCGLPIPRWCPTCHAQVTKDARFCGECGTPLGAELTSLTAEPRPRGPRPADAAERRQLTVLFADIVGATAMSGRLDPETLRDVLRAYQIVCSESIDRYGGRVQQYLGDGVLAYFGYPTAHDNDAERAVLAGLALVSGVQELDRAMKARGELGIEARVGVHTGLVVVGAMGADHAVVDLAVGETPNLASRIQSEAGPNGVCISAAARHLLGPRFRLRAMGSRVLKGVAVPTEIFAVEDAAQIAPDWQSARVATPLFGRDAELENLLQHWDRAKRGHGQVVLLSGEGGIGKSRLVAALRERIAPLGLGWRPIRCSPFHQNSALHPIVDLIDRSIKTSPEPHMADRETTLRRQLEIAGINDAISQALLASLIGVGDPSAHAAVLVDLSPAQLRRRTLDSLIAWLHADTRSTPVVMVVEDLHWIDPSSRELIGMLMERLADWQLLLVLTFRPEFVPPWPSSAQSSTIALSSLGPIEVASIARSVTDGRALPDPVVREIVRRTDGVPLFVEELTKAILASGVVVDSDGELKLADRAWDRFEVPATLRDSLTARLDRLGPAKAVAQLAAVLGREFHYELLQVISDMPGVELEARLAALNGSDIVQQSGSPPQAEYRFRHALIQEAAYDTLLKSARLRHHRRAAEAYVDRFPQLAQLRPELPAHHFSRAAMPESAVLHWQRAGELALARSAHEEAIAHLDAALEQIQLIHESDSRDRCELGLRVKLGPALLARLGFGAARAGANYERACELAERMGDTREGFAALFGDWMYKNSKGQLIAAANRSEQMVRMGARLGDDGNLLQAHHSRWTNFMFLGRVNVVRHDTSEGIRLYDAILHRDHKHLYGGHDPCVCAHNFAATAALDQGYGSTARALINTSLAMAREMDHAMSLSLAYLWAMIVFQSLGDTDAAAISAAQSIEMCERQGFVQWLGLSRIGLGATHAARGELDSGLKLIEAGLALHMESGVPGLSLVSLALSAKAYLLAEDIDRALSLLAQAVELSDRTNVAWQRPEIERLQTISLLRHGQIGSTEAIARLERITALARQHGAATQGWRALNDLAELQAAHGLAERARRQLRDALDSAPGDCDAVELAEARSLFRRLG